MMTAGDIRKFQLVKVAIAASIRILLERNSVMFETILMSTYLTGGLGNYVDRDKVVQLRLLLGIRSERCVKLLNAALVGCKHMFYGLLWRKVEDILEGVAYCSFESDSCFMTCNMTICFFQFEY